MVPPMTVVRRPACSQAGNSMSFTFPANCGKSCRQALVNQSGIKPKRTVPLSHYLKPVSKSDSPLTSK
jgi:hypothetical protein